MMSDFLSCKLFSITYKLMFIHTTVVKVFSNRVTEMFSISLYNMIKCAQKIQWKSRLISLHSKLLVAPVWNHSSWFLIPHVLWNKGFGNNISDKLIRVNQITEARAAEQEDNWPRRTRRKMTCFFNKLIWKNLKLSGIRIFG